MKLFNFLAAAVVAVCSTGLTRLAVAQENLTVLSYHDVVDVAGQKDEVDTVTLNALTKQLQWLKHSGYAFVSADDVLRARAEHRAMPAKSVLLTFDDGYRSFYTHVFPMLRMFNAPAVVAVVGAWHEQQAEAEVRVDGRATAGKEFMTKSQLREVAASGLVELASHTYGLHRSVVANALGSRIPAVIARAYDPVTKATEDELAYANRLKADLLRNAEFLKGVTGKPTRIVAWPYGRYNGTAQRAATATGHELALTLDEVSSSWATSSDTLGRKYIQGSLDLTSFASYVQRTATSTVMRHVAVNMESFVETDSGEPMAEEVEARLSRFIEDAAHSKATAVLVNPFGSNCTPYDRQSQHPVVRDVLSRVVWQLHTRAHARVFLDIDVAGCLDAALARPELLALLNASTFDGLVMRVDAQSGPFARELAHAFVNEVPNRPVASNVEFEGRTRAFQELDACRLPSDENLKRLAQAQSWVELRGAATCDAATAVRRLVDAGMRNWGLPVAPHTLRVPSALRSTGAED